jgi:hypothetical protein
MIKNRFQILKFGPRYPIEQQVKLVYALCAVHNFVLANDNRDYFVVHYTQPDDSVDGDENEEEYPENITPTDAQKAQAKQMRDRIAQGMWDDYSTHLDRN